MGSPVIPTGGSQEKYSYRHAVDHPELKEVYVAGEIEDAEALVCISHVEGHPFQRVLGMVKDPYEQVRQAQRLGVGTTQYELIEVAAAEPAGLTHKKK